MFFDEERIFEIDLHRARIEFLDVVGDVVAQRFGPDPVPMLVHHLNELVDPPRLELVHDTGVDGDVGDGGLAVRIGLRYHLNGEGQVLHSHVHQKPLFILHGCFSSIIDSARWAMIFQISLLNKLTLILALLSERFQASSPAAGPSV